MAEKPLEGQVAIVTGGVRRIGKAIGLALARDGAAVVVNARSSRKEAEATAAEIEAAGGRALVHIGDITDEAVVDGMIEAVVKQFGRIDILVNNAANREAVPFLQMTLQQWRAINSVILDGAFLCARAALRHMAAAKYGRIINIGGVTAHIGATERAHVLTAKAGIIGFTRALALEFAGRGITVNCIVPGGIGGIRSATSGPAAAPPAPVGREGIPEDVADMVRQLCLLSTGYITGQTIHVSGGMYLSS
jgi:3-oxoacyl-[acyl-carrier protein] reductase